MQKKLFYRLQQNYRNIIKGFEALVFPADQNCPLCRQKLPQGGLICDSCRWELELWRQEKKCLYCGRLTAMGEDRCSDCKKSIPIYKSARAVAPYEGHFAQAIKRFKYHNEQWLAEPLGMMMAELIKNEPFYREINLLIPIPLSKRRLAERGFNQSLLLAKVIAQQLDIPLGRNILFKVRETKDQIGLTKKERLTNLEGAYQVEDNSLTRGAVVLLVDDIFTTGSTVHQGSMVLLRNGAKEVRAVTWAGVIG